MVMYLFAWNYYSPKLQFSDGTWRSSGTVDFEAPFSEKHTYYECSGGWVWVRLVGMYVSCWVCCGELEHVSQLRPPCSIKKYGDICMVAKGSNPHQTHPEFLAAMVMAWKLPQRLSLRRCSSSVMTCFSGARAAFFCTASLERWQRRSDRLEGLLRRVKCPRVETFEANGQVYKLPVPAAVPKREPSREELEYLCGNFDGDGCVSMRKANGEIRLVVTQAIDRAEILVRFREALGGCVYREKDATGFRSACLRWQASRRAAQRAASILCSIPSMKQAQLQIAAEATEGIVPEDSRPDVAQLLKSLKAHTYSPLRGTLKCTWPYFAGFFDAEGNITIRSHGCSVYLTVAQVNPFILRELLLFLQREGFEHWKLYQYTRRASTLRCMHLSTAKSCLRQLLANQLTLKRFQAEASVTLTHKNHYETRELVSKQNGLQGFYRRLDETGIEKAKEVTRQKNKIQRLQGQGCTEGWNNSLLEVAEAELQKLEEERELCKVMSRCGKLRRQVRKLLCEGATIMPP